jgi:hypothetical protein
LAANLCHRRDGFSDELMLFESLNLFRAQRTLGNIHAAVAPELAKKLNEARSPRRFAIIERRERAALGLASVAMIVERVAPDNKSVALVLVVAERARSAPKPVAAFLAEGNTRKDVRGR